MPKGFYRIPDPVNEPIYSYDPGSAEREELQAKLAEMHDSIYDVPMYIGGKEVRTDKKIAICPPHEIKHTIGYFYQGDKQHVQDAIDAALAAKKDWVNLGWEHRASIFLKAAELISTKYRARLNAATMLGQSKNAFQAEIDSACEIVDFLRFNVFYMAQIYEEQPESEKGIWNRLEHRALEGFVFALTPFNFTAIAGNLPSAPAMMGNTVVWKPSKTAVYSAGVLMEVFKEAGVPDGVINLVTTSGPNAADIIFKHPDFAGLHFTGSTGVFQDIWRTIGNNIHLYKSYPRIVGETGGKDFIFAHPTAAIAPLATAISRGAFEYQGQKCSAASRAYIPASIWPEVLALVKKDVASMKMGPTTDFSNFINAVIDETSFDNLAEAIDYIKAAPDAEILIGGNYDKTEGYFIEPTLALTSNPQFRTMQEELFGPVITVYVYDDAEVEKMPELIDSTSLYALTGCVFAQDRYAIEWATKALTNSAGNFYINDKPTGAVVGQQPFGGARGSGTNDKAGSLLNMLRWVSPRTIKETFVPPTDYRYPFLGE